MTNGEEPINPVLDFSKIQVTGLTKREYFAAMAMQGLLAGNALDSITTAVAIADNLIQELNKPTP
jgi:hypothetical protein